MKYLPLLFVAFTACGSHVGNGDDGTGTDANGSGSGGPNFPDCDPAKGTTCNGADIVACNADGTFGAVMSSCGQGQTCSLSPGPTCTRACTADGVDLVYVVDEQNHFMSFDPRLPIGNRLHVIGTLNCPNNGTSIQTGGTSAIPMSMSVDRDGVGWVLYTTGELFKVSLQDASCTKANNTINAGNMALFGMGFALDGAMQNTEKLYMSGGNNDPATKPNKLAYDDTHGGNLTPTFVGNLPTATDYNPELTGTADAKLYGFYPRIANNTPSYVQEIDKSTGAGVGQMWNLGANGLGNGIRDWAFAQWGGTFWVFVTTQDNNGVRNSTIRSIDRTTNTYTVVEQNLPYFIDGAGVSTCAPVTIQ